MNAKQAIIELFQAGEVLDQAELADRLDLSLAVVTDICDELVEEGLITFVDIMEACDAEIGNS